MDIIKKARELDRLDKLKEAAEAYEEAIRSTDVPPDVYVDLVALYFDCGDPGTAAGQDLSLEFEEYSYNRLFELKNEVEEKFGTNSEIDFWINYYHYILWGQPVGDEEFERIANSGDSPVPYLVLHTKFPQNKYYRERAKEAYLLSLDRETARKRYLFSILVQTFEDAPVEHVPMNKVEKARLYDRLGKPKEAIEVYEDVMRTIDAPLDVFVDLMAFYFVLGDPGYHLRSKLSKDFLDGLHDRMIQLAAEAKQKFGSNSEIDFWLYCYECLLSGRGVSLVELEKIAGSGDSPVPYVALYLSSNKEEKYLEKAMAALSLAGDFGTTRKCYIHYLLNLNALETMMSSTNLIEKARTFDRLNKLKDAAEGYELAIRIGDAPVDVYVDLVALYFDCGDPGTSGAQHLSVEFGEQAYRRMVELKEEVERKFGTNSEIEFWIKYYDFIHLGQPIEDEEFERIANSGDSPVPYFLFPLKTKNDEYRDKAEQAYRLSLDRDTARKRYIYSILHHTFGKRQSLLKKLFAKLRYILRGLLGAV